MTVKFPFPYDEEKTSKWVIGGRRAGKDCQSPGMRMCEGR